MTTSSSRLSLDDAICPICLDILVDPVTPPCGHSLCGPCFEQTVQSSNLTCPLCRRRLSVWLRRARHSGSVLDSELWRSICRRFPERVLRRLDGAGDTDSPPESPAARSAHTLSQPGEIGAEFEQCLQQLSATELENRRREEQLSERYIEQLLREERSLQAAQELNDRLVAEQLQLAAAPPTPRFSEAAASSVDVPSDDLVHSVDGAVSLQSVDEAVRLHSLVEAVTFQSVDEAVNSRSVDQPTCLQQAVCTPVTKRKSKAQRSVDCSTVSDTSANCFSGVDSTSSRKRCLVSGGTPDSGSGTSGLKRRRRTSSASATGSCKENSNPVRLEESLRADHVASSTKPASASTSGSDLPKTSSSVGIDSGYSFDLDRSSGGCVSSPQLLAEQRAIEQRIQQELADRRMAKRLQKQLNSGSQDRSWGGENEYGLRSHRRP